MTGIPVDRVIEGNIAAAPVLINANGPAIVACGGLFRRSIVGWSFQVAGQTVTVSVPTTLVALEARDAEWRAQVAA